MIDHQLQNEQPGRGRRRVHRRRRILAMTAVLLTAGVGAAATASGAGSPGTVAPGSTVADSAPDDTTVPGPQFDQALHDALPDSIREAGVLVLATDPTDPPLEFYNEDNELVGAEVDLAEALGVVLGVEIELVPTPFDAIIPGVEAGRFDGAVSGFADRVERQEVVDFVDYFTSSRGYLIRTDTLPDLASATDLCGLNVAVAKGTTMADAIDGLSADCEAADKDPIDGQIYPDQSAGVLAVQSGRADLTILSGHAALWISQNSDGALDVVLRPNEGADINGILLAKGGLVEPMQAAVQQLMDSGTLLAIFTEWNLQDLVLDEATVNAGVN